MGSKRLRSSLLLITSLLFIFTLFHFNFFITPQNIALASTSIFDRMDTKIPLVIPPDVAPVYFMSGTPYEMGFQYGEQAKKYIKVASDQCWANQLAWNRNNIEFLKKNLGIYKKALNREMPEMHQIFQGMADGAGLTYDDIMIICAWDRPPACTGLSAFKDATVDGKTIVGQNFDFMWHPFSYTVITAFFPAKETGLHNFIAPTPAGLMAPTGMNDKGLVFTGNGRPATNEQKGSRTLDAVQTLLCGAYVPFKAANAEEAKQLALKIKITAGVNYQVVDETGAAYCVTGNAAGLMARAPGDPLVPTGKSGDPVINDHSPHYMVCTNHYVNPKQLTWNPSRPYGSSIFRFLTAEKMMQEKLGKLDVKAFMDILGSRRYIDDKGTWHEGEWSSNCINRTSSKASGTIYTMIAVPKDRVVYISTGDAQGNWGTGAPGITGEFVELSLKPDRSGKTSPASVTAAAGNTAVKNISIGTQALFVSPNQALKDQLEKAKVIYWHGVNYKREADLIMSAIAIESEKEATNKKRLNKALGYYGKAASAFCKAQVYALQVAHSASQ